MCFRGVYKGFHCVNHRNFFKHHKETVQFYGSKLRKETFLPVESVDGIVPFHLRHKKKSTPLEVFKRSRVEFSKTFPQQLVSHIKMRCYTRNQKKMRIFKLLCVMDKKPSTTTCVRLQRC